MKKRFLRIVRTLFRGFGLGLELLMAFVWVYFALGFIGTAIPVGANGQKGSVELYVRNNGIHTEICMPASNETQDWFDFFSPEDYPEMESPWVNVGWGERDFYLSTPEWSDLTFYRVCHALMIPSPSAMHVAVVKEPATGMNCKRIRLTKQQYKKLTSFIKHSFDTVSDKPKIIPDAGYGERDQFYASPESYHCFHTCNHWTNCALKSADIRTSWIGFFAESNLVHLP